jgi:hypothetical protein
MRYPIVLSIALVLLTSCSKSTTQPSVASSPPLPPSSVPVASPLDQSSQAAGPAVVTSVGKIDVCELLTSKELQAVQGEALKDAKGTAHADGGFMISQCFYSLPTFTNSISLLVAQKGQTAGAREPREFWKETFNRADEEAKTDKKESAREQDKDKGNDKAKAGTRSEAEEEERSAPPRKITGLGDDAYWTGNRVGGALYALKGDTYIRLSVGGPGDQETKIKKAKALAQIVVKRL